MNKNNTEIITVTVSKYLSEELALKISQMLWAQSDADGIRSSLYWLTSDTDSFNVTAQNASGDLAGRILCIQNTDDPTLWYYGDLFVAEKYRRMHIAEKMLAAAFEELKEKGCKAVQTYAEPQNTVSIALQKKLGFEEKPYQKFNSLINDGDIMFEKQFGKIYTAVPIKSKSDIRIIADIYNKALSELHGSKISFDEWCRSLPNKDTDEENFLISRGIMPTAWLKLNGLDSNDEVGYISMLAVEPRCRRRGAGTFAVEFSEAFLHNKGKKTICVQTTNDNTAAIALYKKCGFIETEKYKTIADNGSDTVKIKFKKNI